MQVVSPLSGSKQLKMRYKPANDGPATRGEDPADSGKGVSGLLLLLLLLALFLPSCLPLCSCMIILFFQCGYGCDTRLALALAVPDCKLRSMLKPMASWSHRLLHFRPAPVLQP